MVPARSVGARPKAALAVPSRSRWGAETGKVSRVIARRPTHGGEFLGLDLGEHLQEFVTGFSGEGFGDGVVCAEERRSRGVLPGE